jgi:serine/threonine protein kinase
VPTPGALLGEKYRIVRPLGEGGMGTVFEVENVLTRKHAAIKQLHPQLSAGADLARRVLREAQAMARIRHENVVDVYDVLLGDSEVCLVMELLQGELLSERLARAPVFMDELLGLLLPAMRGVAAAHAVGVIHRDIKPDNIFLAQQLGQARPTPKVIDFGISKVFDADGTVTCSGVTMGTPRYISYEQLRGAREVDGRADIYAFGVILYEALTGRPPYHAETLGQQAIQFVTTMPEAVTHLNPLVPEGLARCVDRAIERERDKRQTSLTELVDALSPFALPEAYPQRLLGFPEWEPYELGGIPDASRTTCSRANLATSDRDHAADVQAGGAQAWFERGFSGQPSLGRTRSWRRPALGIGAVCSVAAVAVSFWALEESPTRAEPAAEVQTSELRTGVGPRAHSESLSAPPAQVQQWPALRTTAQPAPLGIAEVPALTGPPVSPRIDRQPGPEVMSSAAVRRRRKPSQQGSSTELEAAAAARALTESAVTLPRSGHLARHEF